MAGFFNFFNYSKPGPGVDKDMPEKHRFFVFWEVLGRKFWRLTTLNLLFALCSIPALIAYFFLSYPMTHYFQEFAANTGQQITDIHESVIFLTAVLANFTLIVLGAGPVSAGFNYVLRNFARQEHAWVAGDFFEHTKKNFFQGLIVFIVDLIFLALIIVNINFYAGNPPMPSTLKTIMIAIFSVICILYAMMHFYIYPMMVTFDLKLKHIYKNAFLLTMIKLPQNIMLLAVTVAIAAIVSYISMSINIIILLIISFVFLYSFLGLIQMFYSYFVVEKLLMPKEETPLEDV